MNSAIPRIYVAGHRGMLGSAIVRHLLSQGHPPQALVTRSHDELDLTDMAAVRALFAAERPDQVYLAAAKVGGIHANNTYPADFIRINLAIQSNVIQAAFEHGVRRLLFLGSSCVYPREAPQPMAEDALLTQPLEPTNEPYAIAKIAGLKMCESYNRQYGASHGIDYRSVMPTNLCGPGDHYHPENSHVVPALVRRFHEATATGADQVTIWGTGRALREFLHVDDAAAACVHVMNLDTPQHRAITEPMRGHLNVGSDDETSIAELARLVAQVTGFRGEIRFDASRPDGTPRKRLDSRRLRSTGWQPQRTLVQGIEDAYRDFLGRGLAGVGSP